MASSAQEHEYSIVPTSEPSNPNPPDTRNNNIDIVSSAEMQPMTSSKHEYSLLPSSSQPASNPSDLENYSEIESTDTIQQHRMLENSIHPETGTPLPKHVIPNDDPYLGEFDIMMIILLTGFVMCLVFSPATPYVELRSLSITKYNDNNASSSPPSDQMDLTGTWDVQLAVQNLETRWKGFFSEINCTLYREMERTSTFEDPGLRSLAYIRVLEPFILAPKEEKLLKLKLQVQETESVSDWDMVRYGIKISVYSSFENSSSAGWFSGIDDYECSGLNIDRDSGTLSNDVPLTCEFSLPFQEDDVEVNEAEEGEE